MSKIRWSQQERFCTLAEVNVRLRASSSVRLPFSRRLLLGALLSAVTLTCGTGAILPAWSQDLDSAFSGVDNNISAILRYGGNVYVAGAFSLAGPNSGCGVGLDRLTGKIVPGLPKVAGLLYAVVPDGAGGWYIGGAIKGVGGLDRPGIAHILSDGSVANWRPGCDGRVLTIALHNNRLFVGGEFSEIGGEARSNLAELNLVTGKATYWDPSPDNRVLALVPTDTTLIVGGEFSSIAGIPRNCAAALDFNTGNATAWDPNILGGVNVFAVQGDTVFVGGSFYSVGGQLRWKLAAVSGTTGSVTAFAPVVQGHQSSSYDPSPQIVAIIANGGTIYIGGHFAFVAGSHREGLAEVDVASGLPTVWDPQLTLSASGLDDISVTVTSLAQSGQSLYLGGTFVYVGGSFRPCLAEVSRSNGTLTSWDPHAEQIVDALALADNVVFAGGEFGLLGNWERRSNLASFDAGTGVLKPWNPAPDGPVVYSLAAHEGQIVVGGVFGQIGGESRAYIAAVDTMSGAASAWAPQANGSVDAMQVVDGQLFVGGHFTTIADSARQRLASFDLLTGQLTSWRPSASIGVSTIKVQGSAAYVGGSLRAVNGVPRNFLAAIDLVTGETLPWNPNPDSFVQRIEARDSTVFVAGQFKNIGGAPRRSFAAVDANTGVAKSWAADVAHPNPNLARAYSLALHKDTLFVGGSFYSIGGATRGGLAAVNATTGEVLAWDPEPGDPSADYPLQPGIVWALQADDDALYAGGRFRFMGATPVTTFAAFRFPPPPPPSPPPVIPDDLALSISNPIALGGHIRFGLPTPASVTVRFFDVQGRQVETVLNHEYRVAGRYDVAFSSQGWASGVYLCQLEAAGRSAARKVLVVR